MSYTHHCTLLVSTSIREYALVMVEEAEKKGVKCFLDGQRMNGVMTMWVPPSGDKAGWGDHADRLKALEERLRQEDFEDGSSPYHIVRLTYGNLGASIEGTNCKDVTA